MKIIPIFLIGFLLLLGCKVTSQGTQTNAKKTKANRTVPKSMESTSIKSETRTSNEYFQFLEYNKNGKLVFDKNDDLNTGVTMIRASEYDPADREIKLYTVHSNFGFFLTEKEYGKNQIKSWSYTTTAIKKKSYDSQNLKNINTREELINMEAFSDLKSGIKYLAKLEKLDSEGNVIEQVILTEKGDTSSINTFKYNANNKEISFHKRDPKSEFWSWDIFKLYDEKSNLIQSFRVSIGSLKDTIERHNNIYEGDFLKSKDYYYRGQFQNKTTYNYNLDGYMTEELFYEKEENEIKVRKTYRYNRKGNIMEESKDDYRKNSKLQKSKTEFTYEYFR